jgi:hypothetical protein
MESKPKTINHTKEMMLSSGVTNREYEIGNGNAFKRVFTGLFLLNGLIFAQRYGLGENKKFAALVIFGSLPLAYVISKNFFGDTRLNDLGELSYKSLKE